jgi:hypothetical protein
MPPDRFQVLTDLKTNTTGDVCFVLSNCNYQVYGNYTYSESGDLQIVYLNLHYIPGGQCLLGTITLVEGLNRYRLDELLGFSFLTHKEDCEAKVTGTTVTQELDPLCLSDN